MNIRNKIIIAMIIITISIPSMCLADDWYSETKGYYTITKENGEVLFMIGSAVYVNDEYISEDNDRYRIVEVDKQNFIASAIYIESVGEYARDENDGYEVDMLAKEESSNRIGLYCTHSDESYVPTDGTESEPEEGGIFDVTKHLLCHQ